MACWWVQAGHVRRAQKACSGVSSGWFVVGSGVFSGLSVIRCVYCGTQQVLASCSGGLGGHRELRQTVVTRECRQAGIWKGQWATWDAA